MKVLFVSRKKPTDVGGLSRFTHELVNGFPGEKYLLTVPEPKSYITIPYRSIDLIHLCDATLFPLGLVIKSIIHKPLTVTAHGLDLAFPNKIYQSMLRITSPKAHAFIIDSTPVKKLLKNFPIDIKKTVVINPGISINHLRFADENFSLNLTRRFAPQTLSLEKILSSRLVLLTVGNLVKRKGHAWFIKNVFSKLSDNFIYLIVGDGPERQSIQVTIQKLNLENRVFLLGQLPNSELGRVFKKSDIYVCPNQKDAGNFEGFGIAAGEAAALGIPVVATRVDGVPEVIHDKKNGFLVSVNPQEFLQRIYTLKDGKIRKQFGNRAKKYTREHFNWQRTQDQYVKVFEAVLRNNSPRRS